MDENAKLGTGELNLTMLDGRPLEATILADNYIASMRNIELKGRTKDHAVHSDLVSAAMDGYHMATVELFGTLCGITGTTAFQQYIADRLKPLTQSNLQK